MSRASRLRVHLSSESEEFRGAITGVEIVDGPPADVAVFVFDATAGEEAIDSVSVLRDLLGAPVVAVVEAGLTPRRVRSLASRADGIVERPDVVQALEATVRAVAAGQVVYPPPMHRALMQPALSNREKQILAMVVLGFSNAEIADKLVVTESTVKNHLSSAFAKLGVRSRSAATSLILNPDTGLGLGVLQLGASTASE